jgi:hypothetical protein
MQYTKLGLSNLNIDILVTSFDHPGQYTEQTAIDELKDLITTALGSGAALVKETMLILYFSYRVWLYILYTLFAYLLHIELNLRRRINQI